MVDWKFSRKMRKLGIAVSVLIFLIFSFIGPFAKNASAVELSPVDTGESSSTSSDQKSSKDDSQKPACNFGNGLGFIVCPLMWMMSAAIDSTYGLMAQTMAIPTSILTGYDEGGKHINPVLAAYNTFLPYANLVLAVVFLLIIYSEATGNGFGAMNNYSIKKTLPRLIIFAILINLSFYICAAAVDVSNIAGSSMYGLFTGGKGNSLKSQFVEKTHTMLKEGDGN